MKIQIQKKKNNTDNNLRTRNWLLSKLSFIKVLSIIPFRLFGVVNPFTAKGFPTDE